MYVQKHKEDPVLNADVAGVVVCGCEYARFKGIAGPHSVGGEANAAVQGQGGLGQCDHARRFQGRALAASDRQVVPDVDVSIYAHLSMNGQNSSVVLQIIIWQLVAFCQLFYAAALVRDISLPGF